MKQLRYMFTTLSGMMMMMSCSKESPVEGLSFSATSVVPINAEIAAGGSKTIALTVNKRTLNLEVKNTSVTGNGFETKHCSMAMVNGEAVFNLHANTANIQTVGTGVEITAAAFSNPSSGGSLYYTTRPVNGTAYNYVNSNGIRFGNNYYIPFRIKPANNKEAPIYAYLECRITAEKLTVHKMVYNAAGRLSAGGE
ncbi:hypothetical protein SAMN04488128_11219 [Chitinophaga eiseniae]|uniref:Uncharacterized protein n=1 Tax=Chitinophaga eiseniae TaxID=634771 RepID=A0A1T4U7D3_9BACT|nr:hypothetical protein [Chitinophaga eiseniae]SKA48421.1 hypothetical protein SAMN04488128_11219 [Chitinophaga eiseniae]